MAAVNKTAYLLLLATTLLWSGNSIAGRLAVGHVTPMTLVLLRWILAVLVLLPVGARSVAREWKLVRRHLRLLFALGCCGFTLFNVIFYVALTYTTAINVSIEQAGMPILIIVGNFLFFRVRANWLQILGILLTIAGVVLTACHGDPRQLLRLELNFGDAVMLLAVVLYSGYSIALRLKPPLHWRSLMLVLGVSALIAAIPFAAWEQARGAAIWPDARGWALVLYTALGASVVSQLAYIRGNELIGANRAGLFINLVPVFGTFLSIVLLGETLHAYQVAALGLVIGGIVLAEYSGARAPA